MSDGAKSIEDYVDLTPDAIRAGCTLLSSMGQSERWECDWCGDRFVRGRGEEVACPYCPNETAHSREPVIVYDG